MHLNETLSYLLASQTSSCLSRWNLSVPHTTAQLAQQQNISTILFLIASFNIIIMMHLYDFNETYFKIQGLINTSIAVDIHFEGIELFMW